MSREETDQDPEKHHSKDKGGDAPAHHVRVVQQLAQSTSVIRQLRKEHDVCFGTVEIQCAQRNDRQSQVEVISRDNKGIQGYGSREPTVEAVVEEDAHQHKILSNKNT